MKNKVISVAVILLLVVAVVISVKSGKLNIISNKPKSSIMQNESTEEDTNITNIEQGKQYSEEEAESIIDSIGQAVIDVTDAAGNTIEKEIIRDKSMDNSLLLKIGEETVYENIKPWLGGKTSSESSRYNIKYMDCKISQDKPDGMEINFYPEDAEQCYDENGRFEDNTYYYVDITYELTNLYEEEWKNYGYPTQNVDIGYYDEDGFERQSEPIGLIVRGQADLNSVVYLERNATAIIESCYAVSKEFLSHDNIVVKVDATGDSKAGKVPYLVIDTEIIGVTEK